MPVNWDNVVVGVTFTFIAGILGFLFMILGVFILPKIANRFTPNLDEEKEILRGNMAMAKYFGSVVHAMIIGLSIIIAAAVIAGLHG